MKVKLLKKLRKNYIIEIRNNEYRVFDTEEYSGGVYIKTPWLTKEEAIEIRRSWILKQARKNKQPKQILK